MPEWACPPRQDEQASRRQSGQPATTERSKEHRTMIETKIKWDVVEKLTKEQGLLSKTFF